MDVSGAELTVPLHEAREQFRHYRALIKTKRGTKDDVALFRSLRAMMRGQKVLDINLAIANADVDPATGLPWLAIGRADWPTTRVWTHAGKYVFTKRDKPWLNADRVLASEVRVTIPGAVRHFGEGVSRRHFADVSGRAQTPMIPAQFRPAGSLAGYWILFEAEWQRVPPGDPILLRPLSGPFYVVLATWDLTPLEQAVLRHKL